jgi:hypothetical protein
MHVEGGGSVGLDACDSAFLHERRHVAPLTLQLVCYVDKLRIVQEQGMRVVPIGAFSYSNNNVLGTLQRFTSTFQMHHWHDRCINVMWTNPWLQGSSDRRRLTQSVAGSINRVNEDTIFRVVDDGGNSDGGAGSDDGGQAPNTVTVERSTLSIERSAALTESSYGTVGEALTTLCILHSHPCAIISHSHCSPVTFTQCVAPCDFPH